METRAAGKSGEEKITLGGNHFLKIVYEGPNELSNLFSCS